MPMQRRTFLSGLAAATGTAVAVQGLPRWASAEPPIAGPPFTLGVASGDPLADAVVLWTRLAPDPLNGGGMPVAPIAVDWQVSTDEAFANVVASGTATALPEHAHSVHVDVTGLAAGAWFYYRFKAGGFDSPVGRTRTAPAGSASPAAVNLGFASCQSYTSGYYTAHAHLAQEALDLVFFLGDYIYEGGGTGVRPHNGGEIYSLEDYRNRYALYKGDPNLQAAHAAFPWVVVWDDHEVENNYAGSHDENGSDPTAFLVRRAAAYKAWWEHQPVRMAPPSGPDLPIYRSIPWGDLASFFALDTRQYRDPQVCVAGGLLGDLGEPCPDNFDPARTMLGSAQESWLLQGMLASTSTWNVLAQQVVFAPMPFGNAYNQDQWDGYPGPRQKIIDTMARPEVQNPLVITGDIHAAGVGNIHLSGEDVSSPQVGTELVGSSISSGFGQEELIAAVEAIVGALPWARYVNAHDRGYTTVELTPSNAHAAFRVVSSVTDQTASISTDFTWDIPAVLKQAPTPSSTTSSQPGSTAGPTSTRSSSAQGGVATPRFAG